jgi:hypothetical protein
MGCHRCPWSREVMHSFRSGELGMAGDGLKTSMSASLKLEPVAIGPLPR